MAGDRVGIGARSQPAPWQPLGQQPPGQQQRVSGPFGPPASHKPRPWPAIRAADRLGMEAAVGGIVVFGRAGGAHGERRHRGQRPVVGDTGNDREPRPAVGAVDERVAEPPVGLVCQLGQAVAAGGTVSRDQGPAAAGWVADSDGEPPAPRPRPGRRAGQYCPQGQSRIRDEPWHLPGELPPA
jgi:hypothetical protein